MWPRNAERGEYHELLLVSSVVTVVLVRVGLHLTGYPRIESGSLHIAHLLWGGLSMLASVILLLTYLSRRVMRLAALLGGIGFGLFVDELGKFITRENDYFFRPALSLIYVSFIVLFLLGRGVRGGRELGETEQRLNAALSSERDDVVDIYGRAKTMGRALVGRRTLAVSVILIFLLQALAYVAALVLMAIFELSGGQKEPTSVPRGDVPIALVAALTAFCYGGLVIIGAIRMITDRAAGVGWFLKATLFNLLVVQPFDFYEHQISAVLGLGFNLAAYAILRSALHRPQTRDLAPVSAA